MGDSAGLGGLPKEFTGVTRGLEKLHGKSANPLDQLTSQVLRQTRRKKLDVVANLATARSEGYWLFNLMT